MAGNNNNNTKEDICAQDVAAKDERSDFTDLKIKHLPHPQSAAERQKWHFSFSLGGGVNGRSGLNRVHVKPSNLRSAVLRTRSESESVSI